MQFEVQGQSYFLKFHEGDGRWYLLRPTAHGVTGMPVFNDSGPATGAIVMPDEEDATVIN